MRALLIVTDRVSSSDERNQPGVSVPTTNWEGISSSDWHRR